MASVFVVFAAATDAYLVANASIYGFTPIQLANLGLGAVLLTIAANLLPSVARASNSPPAPATPAK